MVWEARQWVWEVGGYTVLVPGKQKGVNAGAQLAFSFLSFLSWPGTQPTNGASHM